MWEPKGLPLGEIGVGWLVPVSRLHIDLDQFENEATSELSFFLSGGHSQNQYAVICKIYLVSFGWGVGYRSCAPIWMWIQHICIIACHITKIMLKSTIITTWMGCVLSGV